MPAQRAHHSELKLPLSAVHAFRIQRQMLTLDTKGQGCQGVVSVLKIVQPAPGGLRWLTARMQTLDLNPWWELAGDGRLIKARFFRGTLGWVLREDLELYLDACQEELPPPLSETAHQILEILSDQEPLETEILQAEARISRPVLREALVELGRNQLIVEGPQDLWRLTDSLMAQSNRTNRQEMYARAELVNRFLTNYGPATLRELADWSGWSKKIVQAAIDSLMTSQTVVLCQLDDDSQIYYVRPLDVPEILQNHSTGHTLSILACYDPVVRAQQVELKRCYGYGSSISAFWHYLLIDGEWAGALRIHYKMKMLWIRELILDELVMASSSLLQETFEAIRYQLTAGLDFIRIDWINGSPADSFVDQEMLSNLGYSIQDGSYVLDLT